jgi:RNA polymerase sigma-70 factor (ECF subfamily)
LAGDRAFWKIFLAETRSDAAADPALEEALAKLLSVSRTAWPALDLDDDDFVRWVAARVPHDEAASNALARLHAGDLFLACACTRAEPKALAAFEARYLARVPTYLAKMRLPETFVEEVRQALAEKLLVSSGGAPPRIAEYSGRGPLESWVRIAAIRAAISLARRRKPQETLSDDAVHDALPRGTDPELEILRRRSRTDFTEAFRAAFAALSPRSRNLLRLRYLDGAGVGELAVVYGVHRTTLARWLADAEQEALEETRGRLRERLHLTPTECDSLIRLARSRLEETLSGLLRSVA